MLKFPNFSFPIPRHTFPPLRCKTRPYVGPKEFSKFEHVSSTRFPFIVDRRTEPLWGTRDFCRTLQSPTSVVHQCHQPSSGTLWQMFPTTGLYLYDTTEWCCTARGRASSQSVCAQSAPCNGQSGSGWVLHACTFCTLRWCMNESTTPTPTTFFRPPTTVSRLVYFSPSP